MSDLLEKLGTKPTLWLLIALLASGNGAQGVQLLFGGLVSPEQRNAENAALLALAREYTELEQRCSE